MANKLSHAQRTEIVSLYHLNSSREVARIFNQRYPNRVPLSHRTVTKNFNKFKETGAVFDKKRSGRPKTSVTDDNALAALALVASEPLTNIREVDISTGSLRTILKKYKFHPYKMQMLNNDWISRINSLVWPITIPCSHTTLSRQMRVFSHWKELWISRITGKMLWNVWSCIFSYLNLIFVPNFQILVRYKSALVQRL